MALSNPNAAPQIEFGLINPKSSAEHTHDEIQVTVGFPGASVLARWHTSTGKSIYRKQRGTYTSVVPARQPHAIEWAKTADLLLLFVSPSFVHTAVEHRFEITESYLERDTVILGVGASLRDAIRLGMKSNLLIESAGIIIASRLAFLANSQVSLDHAGRLSPREVTVIREHIHDHLSTDLTISELAALIGTSPHRLRRAFRQTLGIAPHQYVLATRVEEAKRRLKGTTSIADLSSDLGFSSQAHFTGVFRKSVGVTPAKFRRSS